MTIGRFYMVDIITITISFIALIISLITAWLTLFRKGTVCMTQPTVIFFGYDPSKTIDAELHPKIYFRTLLFSTAKRGCIIESMYVSLKRDEYCHNFSIWVYGDNNLSRGSGVFVGETGITANHHFLLPQGESTFEFKPGQYQLLIYIRLLGSSEKLLFKQDLTITEEASEGLKESNCGLFFDWRPETSRYHYHLDNR